jgi:MFS family permease
VWAGLVGMAMGLFVPSITAMIAVYFEAMNECRPGTQSTFVNGGGILILFFGGLLATIVWNYNYLIYTILGVPILIVALFGFRNTNVPLSVKSGKSILASRLSIMLLSPCFTTWRSTFCQRILVAACQ